MNEITYTMVGDYNLPNLILPEQPEVIQGKWSQMRRTYLKEHHKVQYYNLLTKGILTSHLSEVEQRATELEETLIRQMAEKEGLTEQMKADDMMKWVRLMNNIRNSAQEIVKGTDNIHLEYYDRSNEDKSLPFFGRDDTIREILGTTPHLSASLEDIKDFYERQSG